MDICFFGTEGMIINLNTGLMIEDITDETDLETVVLVTPPNGEEGYELTGQRADEVLTRGQQLCELTDLKERKERALAAQVLQLTGGPQP